MLARYAAHMATNQATQGTDIVVEIRGGTAVAMYTDDPNARLILVDWDEFNEGGRPGVLYPVQATSEMPSDTRDMVRHALQA